MDKKIIVIICLVLVILVIGYVYSYNVVKSKAYEKGVTDGVSITSQQIINELNRNGFVTIYINQNNQSIPVRLGVIQ